LISPASDGESLDQRVATAEERRTADMTHTHTHTHREATPPRQRPAHSAPPTDHVKIVSGPCSFFVG